MGQIERKFEQKLKRIDPISDQITKIISIKSSLIDRSGDPRGLKI